MENYLGEIRVFSFSIVPRGWAACNGQLLSVSQNQALFALIGTFYGGNGTTNFQLPDFRGRTPIGVGRAVYGTTYVVGEQAGEENVALNTTTMPAHIHMMTALSTPAASGLGPTPPRVIAAPVKTGATDVMFAFSNANTGQTPLFPQSLSMTGSGAAHPNMPPFLTANICIALSGIFPSRN
jgi:microcystin-dependent protein